MLNVGIHLDNCPTSNGGLKVAPGTQNQSVFKLLFGKKQFVDHKSLMYVKSVLKSKSGLTVHDGRLAAPCGSITKYGEKISSPCRAFLSTGENTLPKDENK
jgi:hypothetical protein